MAKEIKDIQDNERDEERMQPEETTMDLPDVNDIPGQENVRPMPLGELADTTASSDDEEGKGVLDDDDSNVTDEERELLDRSANSDPAYRDERNFQEAALDNRDADGELLNEENSIDDLDVPGSEDDDDMEQNGAEDEENNAFSDSDTE